MVGRAGRKAFSTFGLPGRERELGAEAARCFPNVWGQAQTFAPSGLNLETDWHTPFVGQTLAHHTGLLFHAGVDPTASFDLRLGGASSEGVVREGEPGRTTPRVIGPDVLDLEIELSPYSLVSYRLVWLDKSSLIGEGIGRGARPCVTTNVSAYNALEVIDEAPALVWPGALVKGEGRRQVISGGEIGRFALVWGPEPSELAAHALNSDLDSVFLEHMKFYEGLRLPATDRDDVLRTYVKACAIMKVNVETPCGRITRRWTTPDRWPHRHMWLWDSAFHALGGQHIDEELGRDCIRSVLTKQRSSGFIPHTMAPDPKYDSQITQPPVLSWATWELHRQNPSLDFLAEVYPGLRDYVGWDLRNMDRLESGLLQWQHAGHDSGMDNSPRFDRGPDFDAVDLNCFISMECEVLAEVAREVGFEDESEMWAKLRAELSDAVNSRLWNNSEGFYYDRRKNGSWVKVKTVDHFLPLFSGIASKGAAKRLVEEHLTNAEEFWPKFPIPSVALNEPCFELDMWRGPTWVNYNWLITCGLRRYHYDSIADELVEATIREVSRWRARAGSIYEFYDPLGRTAPQDLKRKGRVRRWPDDGIPVISDFFWSSALYVNMVIDKYGFA